MDTPRLQIGPAVWLTVIAAVAGTLWTMLTLTGSLTGLDQGAEITPPPLASDFGQVLVAFALVTWPGVLYLVVAGIGIWAYRRRLRNLAVASGLTVVLTVAAAYGAKFLLQRPRPAGAVDLITSEQWSYPSGHMAAVVATIVIAVAATASTRQSVRARVTGGVIGAVVGVAVAVDHWLLQTHHVTDLVAGALLGAMTSGLALAVMKVRVEPRHSRNAAPTRSCAIIVNPTKVEDWGALRRHLEHEAGAAGWQPIWLETTADDLGDEVTHQALNMGVELVIAAGGDGTVRQVCKALAGGDVPMGILPLGTGNLLAHNLRIPIDEADALAVVFRGKPRSIDLIRLHIDDEPEEMSAVMAGLGFDAVIMNATNPELKKIVGPAAYFLAAPQALAAEPFKCRVVIRSGTDEKSVETSASMALVGNVSRITAQIEVLPDAKPDDGLLDLILASPNDVTDWARIAASVVSGASDPAEVARATGTEVEIEVLGEPIEFQIDGDTAGKCRRIRAEVVPGAISVLVPNRAW